MTTAPVIPPSERPLSTAALAMIREMAEVMAKRDHEEELQNGMVQPGGQVGHGSSSDRVQQRGGHPLHNRLGDPQVHPKMGGKSGRKSLSPLTGGANCQAPSLAPGARKWTNLGADAPTQSG